LTGPSEVAGVDPVGLTNFAPQSPFTYEITKAGKKVQEEAVHISKAIWTNYSGTQKNFSDPQTQAILRRLNDVLETRESDQLPRTLTGLEFQLRPYSRGQATLEQKFSLYGGSPSMELKLPPLAFASLELAFERHQLNRIYSKIVGEARNFSSHTIVAPPGQGKSIALAQVLLRLCETPGCWTFWSFNPAKTFACESSHHCVERYFSLFRRTGYLPRKIVFMFDDLQRRTNDDYLAIHEFHSWCEHLGFHEDVSIAFLCSSSEPEQSISLECNTVQLRLDPEDENSLYEVLTEAAPAVVRRAYDRLDDLLAAQPYTHHWKDDVQSLTDFIVQHSRPIRDFVPNWFSDLKDEAPLAKHILPIIAVSQLLDLPLPEHVAHRIAGLNEDEPARSRAELLTSSRRISHVSGRGDEYLDEWPGYILRSPYYARSLLRRLGNLEEAFVEKTIVQIVDHSLARAERQFQLWNATDAEFVRHVFQRVAKRKFGRLTGIADGSRIAAELFRHHGARISRILMNQRAVVNCARWAGAFAYLFPQSIPEPIGLTEGAVEHVVYDLCSLVLREERVIENSKAFVPLMWAIRALCMRCNQDSLVRDLAEAAERTIDLQRVLTLVLSNGSSEWERRANEVVLSYVKFVMAIPNRSRGKVNRELSKAYSEVERNFSAYFRFDAANWTQRAQVIWIRGAHDIELRGRYLWQARQAVLARVREQARWKSRVDHLIERFERRYKRSIDDFADGRGAHLRM
jgi:hypothetical protein